MKGIQIFTMIRRNDKKGVSGTGKVLVGVIFPSGVTVVEWQTQIRSQVIFDNFDCFKAIHVDHHGENKTQIVFEKLERGKAL